MLLTARTAAATTSSGIVAPLDSGGAPSVMSFEQLRRLRKAASGGDGARQPARRRHSGQLAAWYASMTDFEMRPRSFTLCPFARAHSRIAAVSSRFERAGFSSAA